MAVVTMFAFSATVLGIASNFAKLFLPHVQRELRFIIVAKNQRAGFR